MLQIKKKYRAHSSLSLLCASIPEITLRGSLHISKKGEGMKNKEKLKKTEDRELSWRSEGRNQPGISK